MTEEDVARVTKHLADLRLQVNALEISAKNGSLPEQLRQTRRSITLTGLLIAGALLLSVMMRMWESHDVKTLERRVQDLEQRMELLSSKTK